MSRKIILIKQELLLLVYELNRSGLLAENEKIRSEERFSRNAETDLVCRLLLEKKNKKEKRKKKSINNKSNINFYLLQCTLVLPFLSFFFNYTATTEIYTLSLHDALPIFHDAEVNTFGYF